MNSIPAQPKLYHITHVDNLPAIVADGFLRADAQIRTRGGPQSPIGMEDIKNRRMRLPVKCHPGDTVGEYVPFYFCPRSVMLYVLHRGNHPNLRYSAGQRPIVHLQMDLHAVVQYCQTGRIRWAFTDRNAGSAYARFFSQLTDLGHVNWQAVDATDFREPAIKDGKQAEMLVHGQAPWTLVEGIGVFDAAIGKLVRKHIATSSHVPKVGVRRRWYY